MYRISLSQASKKSIPALQARHISTPTININIQHQLTVTTNKSRKASRSKSKPLISWTTSVSSLAAMIAALCRRSRNPDEIPRAPNHGANPTVAVACIFLSAALFPLFRVTRRIWPLATDTGQGRVLTQQWDAVRNHAIHENMTGRIAPMVGPRRFCDTSPFLDITLSIRCCGVNAHRLGCRVAFFVFRNSNVSYFIGGVVEINNSNELFACHMCGILIFSTL